MLNNSTGNKCHLTSKTHCMPDSPLVQSGRAGATPGSGLLGGTWRPPAGHCQRWEAALQLLGYKNTWQKAIVAKTGQHELQGPALYNSLQVLKLQSGQHHQMTNMKKYWLLQAHPLSQLPTMLHAGQVLT